VSCFSPLTAYRGTEVLPSGKRSIVFQPGQAVTGLPISLPCGRCMGCRLERSRQWAVRLVHEGASHEDKCFLTLTYDQEHLPRDGSLDLSEFQRFMKRLRKRVSPAKVRFFHCGEYGEQLGRPHYHCILFGYDFPDKLLFKRGSEPSLNLYTSDILAELWPLGFSTIGAVTFESSAYVARYVTKKWMGPGQEEHYGGKRPEYVTMSRRPGIGAAWIEKFQSDVFPADEVVLRGRKMAPPRYYRQIYELTDPVQAELAKQRRAAQGAEAELRERLEDVGASTQWKEIVAAKKSGAAVRVRAPRARISVRAEVARKRAQQSAGRPFEKGTKL